MLRDAVVKTCQVYRFEHTKVAKLLIEAGAEVNIRGNKYFSAKTALFLAEHGGHPEIAALLKQKEATLEGSNASKM